jgi:hypothetical protein
MIRHSSDRAPALVALAEHIGAFRLPDLDIVGCEPVEGAALPEPFRRLLVHQDHMTTRLTDYFGGPLALQVLSERLDGEQYAREVVLRLAAGGRVIEYGIARINLAMTGSEVRRQILERRTPLGDILVRHRVLRLIEPRWFMRFHAGARALRYFAPGTTPSGYGRLATIHCNGVPTVELLEVLGDVGLEST